MTKHTHPAPRHTSDSGLENNLDHDDHDHDAYDDHDHDHDERPSLSAAGSAAVKRKRLTQACDCCRKKKIKCDGAKPSCANCVKLDIQCTYLPSMKKRGPRQGYIELLEKRLDKMEKMLQHGPSALDAEFLDSKQSASDGESDIADPSFSRPEISDVRFFGETSPLYHYTGNEEMSHLANNRVHASPTKTKCPIYGIKDEVPRKDILDHLVQLFFDSVYYQFPVIHPGSFMKQYREGKVSPNLLNAMCAGVARFSTHPDVITTPSFLAGEPFASSVRASLVDSVDIPTVSNVQALIFLSMYEYGAARGPRAWMFGGMAIRMAQELGLNREDSSPIYYLKGDWVMRETRRRTFWACFAMDVLGSSSSGRPRMIDERDCEVLLPSEDNAWHEARPVVTEMLDNDQGGDNSFEEQQRSPLNKKKSGANDTEKRNMAPSTPQPSSHAKEGEERQGAHCLSSFAYLIRILAVLGKISQYVNRPRTKNSIPPNEPGSEFSIIEAALAAWLQSVPSHLLYSSDSAMILKDKGEGCIIIFMHVIYNTSVVLLHRPILAVDKASFPMDSTFVENSIARCTDAASRVSDVLESVSSQHYPPRIYISSFFAYPVFTTATIHITNAFASNPTIAAKARRNLCIHVKILQTMKSYWAMADKFFYIIRDLYSIQSKINSSVASGGIIVPQVVSHNPHGGSRDYAADNAVIALKTKGENRSRDDPNKGNETGNRGALGEDAASRMVVDGKQASISSFLKSDSGLIALWRRATEMQVIDEANQQKKKAIMAKELANPQHVIVQDDKENLLEEKELQEQQNRTNQLEIQEINLEFERQWKAKMLEHQQLKNGGGSQQESYEDEYPGRTSQEKRQTDGEGLTNPREPKQPRISNDRTSALSQPHIASRQVSSDPSSSGIPCNNATWLEAEQSQHQPTAQPGSTLSGSLTYRHTLLPRPEKPQQNQGPDAFMLQPMLAPTSTAVTSSANAPADVSQHLMQVYSQQHHPQEVLSYANDMGQNANVRQQQQQFQQQQQQAPVPTSLAFGSPGGFSSEFVPTSSATVQHQQPTNPFQLQQQQQGIFSGSGYGPPLVYGSSYSQDQSSRVRAEISNSIFDFEMPLGDLDFLSSSFQMAPMATPQSQSNETMMESVRMTGSNPVSTSSLPSMQAVSSLGLPPQSQPSGSGPLTTDLGSSVSASNSERYTSFTSLLLPGVEGQSPTMGSRGASSSKSSPMTQDNSPGLHSFMVSDDAFADMHTSPDSLVRYLQMHHQQQQRQQMQFQQQDMQPWLNQQNSLIYDNYSQWSQLLPTSSGPTPGALQPHKQPQPEQLLSMNVDADASMPARALVHTSIPSFS